MSVDEYKLQYANGNAARTEEEKQKIIEEAAYHYGKYMTALGFDWENDNTHPYEYDTECENWEFYPTGGNPDGYMLNCFPENKILEDQLLLKTLKDL